MSCFLLHKKEVIIKSMNDFFTINLDIAASADALRKVSVGDIIHVSEGDSTKRKYYPIVTYSLILKIRSLNNQFDKNGDVQVGLFEVDVLDLKAFYICQVLFDATMYPVQIKSIYHKDKSGTFFGEVFK